ncbi:PQQ-dependent sugar dehydrogenase [Microvirga sp. 0TCS3.31]|jgi:glucose/arabinose dehydrogenase
MAVLTGGRGSDRLVGTSSADVIYGYHPGAGSRPTMAANAIVSGLDNPLYVTSPPNSSDHLFILEKGGRVKVYNADTGQTLGNPFLDVTSQIATSGEQGLLGLAFAPDYATSRKLYVYLSTTNQDVEIREYRAPASNPLVADPASMRPIARIDYPSTTTNHRGGWIGFGPDGYLYAATGDGAVRANAQSLDNQLGKILRLNVNADAFPADPNRNYALPADNPASIAGIAGSAVGTGIFAAGLRNPWRASFDRLTGDLYIGDVGEVSFEEINLGRSGGNYGWGVTEGSFNPGSFPNYTNPIYAYGRDLGQTVTGGYVYRGPERDFQGTYFFSDFSRGDIWSLQRVSGSWRFTDLTGSVTVGGGPIGPVSSMAEDASGNLYIVDFGGKIFRLDLKSSIGPVPSKDAGDILSGGGGNDRIYGGGGNDRIFGDGGNDRIYGGSGNDVLRGGPGADFLSGGSGFDYADYRDAPRRVTVDLSKTAQTGGHASGDRLSSIESVFGSAFNDSLRGSTGQNTLRGGGGNDGLSGNAGDDRIYGDAGRDTINVSVGKDRVSGGSGADVFRWWSMSAMSAAADQADVVTDFSRGAHDRLDLARIDANSILGGNQAFAFVGRGAFTAPGQVRYEVVGSEAHVFLNTDADLDAEGMIRLLHLQSLTKGDFLL